MTEEKKLLERLGKMFPDGTVYASQLRKKEKLQAALNGFSLSAGQTPAQWLAERGMTWAETGYVEQDMRPRGKAAAPAGFEAFDLAHFIFRKYPLVGACILTPEEDRLLYQASKTTVKQFLRGDYSAERRECAVLALESVRMIRGWNWPDRDSNGAEAAFWRYLFQQFGVHTENSSTAEERLVDGFTMAIDTVMEFYKRFMVPNGRLQYSTTLLLHALAPRAEMEDLFRELFHFYSRTLHYQYRAGDVGFGVLAEELLQRWEEEATARDPSARERKLSRPKNRKIGRPRKEDQFVNESPAISGLHTLFRYRPAYAVALCDELVSKMDVLLKEETLDTSRDYWNLLLTEWYQRKGAAERARIQDARRGSYAEYVAVSGGSVSVRYAMDRERVGLELPGIRLPVPGEARPVFRVFQADTLIYSETLEASGTVPTTIGRFLPLDETGYDFSLPPELRVEIEYRGALLYRSGEELCRRWLIFDEAGNPRKLKSGAAWLFAGDGQTVTINGGDSVRCDFPGQLYRLSMDTLSQLCVDGQEVVSAAVSRFRHHTSVRRVDLARVDVRGKLYDLYPGPFQLLIRMTDRDRAIRYYVEVDGVRYPPEAMEIGQSEILLTPADTPHVPHRVQVFAQNGTLQDEYNYMILNGCRISMDRRLYREGADEASVRIVWNGRTRLYALPLPPGVDSVSLTLPGLEYPVEIDVPVVHCTFRGRNAFLSSEAVWHRNLAPDEILTLRLPSGWNAQLMLGIRPVPDNGTGARFLLGEMLAREAPSGKEAPLWISLWDGSGPSHRITYQLATLMFEPSFLRGPLEVENRQLLWQAEENFVGEADSRFIVALTAPDGSVSRFETNSNDAVLADLRDFSEGRYAYRVFPLEQDPPETAPLYEGSMIVGDTRKFAFTGKQIVITGALCWDFDADDLRTVPMEEGCGVLRDIRYQGSSLPPGESIQTSEYSATLYYTDEDTGALLAFHEKADDYFEQVNPVTLWTINEHLLILQGATGDTLYIDNQTASILYRNPDSVMTRDEQRERLETPDYFEYRMEDMPRDEP
ncbi:MAG: hypothetical protein IJR54_01355 [Oscillibacter sp.]|nr:hypothetical protein [Oscillibacter sp.]